MHARMNSVCVCVCVCARVLVGGVLAAHNTLAFFVPNHHTHTHTHPPYTDKCKMVDCPEATLDQLSGVHTPELINFVQSMAAGGAPPPDYPMQVGAVDS